MFSFTAFRHIAIVAHDFSIMKNFYCSILGFQLIREFTISSEDFRTGVGIPNASARGCHIRIPGTSVEIEMFEYEQKYENNPLMSSADYPGYRHFALIVDDLEKAYSELASKGVQFFSLPIHIKEPASVAGARFVYFRDPEGNIIELNQLPPGLTPNSE